VWGGSIYSNFLLSHSHPILNHRELLEGRVFNCLSMSCARGTYHVLATREEHKTGGLIDLNFFTSFLGLIKEDLD
jgi:hypothetical protein